MKLRVLALVGLLAIAPSVPWGVRAALNHDWRGSELPSIPDAVAVAFMNAFGRELGCEMHNWSPRCDADFAKEIRSIPLLTAGARDAGEVLVVDLADHHAGDLWSVGGNVLISDDIRAVLAGLGITGGIYLP